MVVGRVNSLMREVGLKAEHGCEYVRGIEAFLQVDLDSVGDASLKTTRLFPFWTTETAG